MTTKKKKPTPQVPSSQEALDERANEITKQVSESNVHELTEESIQELKPDLDFSQIKFVHSTLADNMIGLADQMLDNMTKQMGSKQNAPEIKGVISMFENAFKIKDRNNKSGRPLNQDEDLKNFIPILTQRIEQGEGTRIEGLLKAENTFEQGSHKNRTKFLLASIDVGAKIEVAKVNWNFAVQTYKEAKELAEDTFKKAIYDAYVEEYNRIEGSRGNNITTLILRHENSFSYATKITQAIDAYGKSIQKINDDLIAAFSKLTTDLGKNWNSMAQAQTTLLLENRTDSLNLWKSIKEAYNKLFGK